MMREEGLSDDDFEQLCMLVRISLPYAGIRIQASEPDAILLKLIDSSSTQLNIDPAVSVLDEVINKLVKLGHIASFCTSCSRGERCGSCFMDLCKSGQIHNFCFPNALMTLKEYIADYALMDTRIYGTDLILKQLYSISDAHLRATVVRALKEIRNGERDFRF
jgi:2-iminoacetate synthase